MVLTIFVKGKVSPGYVCLSSEEDMVGLMEMNVLQIARVRRKSVAKQLVLFDYLTHIELSPCARLYNKYKENFSKKCFIYTVVF